MKIMPPIFLSSNLIFLLVLITAPSCKDKDRSVVSTYQSTGSLLSDTVLHKRHVGTIHWLNTLLEHHSLKAGLIKIYLNDSCGIQSYTYKTIKEDFEGFKQIGYIRNINKRDSDFVLPPLTFCEEGESYYFTDTTLPRLQTDSYCCHPTNVFATDDIDEDGTNEIVEFYSTCVSRFKALRVWTLKDKTWKEVASVVYDLDHGEVPMQKRIRKISKGHFQLLELTDESIKAVGNNGAWIDHIL